MGRLCTGGALCQLTVAFGRISSSTSVCSRSTHLETGHFSSAWVLPVEYSVFGTRALLGSTVDTCSTKGFGRISLIFYGAVNSNPEAFALHSV